MTVITGQSPLSSQALKALFSCSNHIGDTYGLSREIVDLLIIFSYIWDSLPENGRILFHRSDATISYAFDYDDDPMGRPYLESAHAYYRLICESRAGREFDATGPEWIAGYMEQRGGPVHSDSFAA